MKEKKRPSPIESAKKKLIVTEAKEGETLRVFQAKTFLEFLENLSKEKPEKSLIELAKQIQTEQSVSLEKQLAIMIKQANAFTELHKMAKQEKSRHIATVEAQIKKEKEAFKKQWDFNLGLLAAPDPSKPSLPKTSGAKESLLDELRNRNYYAAHVADFEILLCHKSLSGQKKDTPLDKFNSGGKRNYDVVVNGTFFSGKPLGTIIVGGKLVKATTEPKSKNRGALAQLKDGSFAMALTDDNSEAGVRQPFENRNNPEKNVVNLMAGGALIIKDGKAITGEEIVRFQKFDQPSAALKKREKKKGKNKAEIKATTAWDSEQLADPVHNSFAIHKGDLYLIVTKGKTSKDGKTGKQIQADLMELGFDSAIIFDGGSRCYLDSEEKTIISNSPGKKVSDIPCGFGITIKKQEASE